MNNKGYVFITILLFFLFLIAFLVVLFKISVVESVNEASYLQGVVEKVDLNYSLMVINKVAAQKLLIYGNLSNNSLIKGFNDSLGGLLINDDPVIPFVVDSVFYSIGGVNVSYPQKDLLINISYPLISLLKAEQVFNPQLIQSCLDNQDCAGNRDRFDSLLVDCLPVIDGFQMTNDSVPLLFGHELMVELCFGGDKTLLLFPFWLGSFVFEC